MTEQERALEKLKNAAEERKLARSGAEEIERRYADASLDFALTIRLARQRAKISTLDFAKRIKCSPAMLSLMESGERRWTVEAANRAVQEITQKS